MKKLKVKKKYLFYLLILGLGIFFPQLLYLLFKNKESVFFPMVFYLFFFLFGILLSFCYLIYQMRKNPSLFKRKRGQEVRTLSLILKFIYLCFPILFPIVYLIVTGLLDVIFLPSIFAGCGYSSLNAWSLTQIISVWGFHLNLLFVVPFCFLIFKKHHDFSSYFSLPHRLERTFFLIFPVTIFISLLSEAVWTVIYGDFFYHSFVYSLLALEIPLFSFLFFFSLLLCKRKDYRILLKSSMFAFVINFLLKKPLALAFYHISLPAFYGCILSQILSYFVFFFLILYFLHQKYHLDYEDTVRFIFDVLIRTLIIGILLLILEHFFIFPTSRILCFFTVLIFMMLAVFLFYLFFSKSLK